MGVIKNIVNKINTQPDAGWIFLTTVLGVGAFGVLFCLVWFIDLVSKGMPIGWLIFNIAIVVFCVWAIFCGIIPMAKEAYKDIRNKDGGQH